jgi:hypothetical protein
MRSISILIVTVLLAGSASADCGSAQKCKYSTGEKAFHQVQDFLDGGAEIIVHSGRGVKDPVCYISVVQQGTFCEFDYPEGWLIDGQDPCAVGKDKTIISLEDFAGLIANAPRYVVEHSSCSSCR